MWRSENHMQQQLSFPEKSSFWPLEISMKGKNVKKNFKKLKIYAYNQCFFEDLLTIFGFVMKIDFLFQNEKNLKESFFSVTPGNEYFLGEKRPVIKKL